MVGVIVIETERMEIHFLSDVFVAIITVLVSYLTLKLPIISIACVSSETGFSPPRGGGVVPYIAILV